MTTVTRGRIVIPTTVYIKPESTGFNIYISTTINELIVKDLQLNKIYLVFGSVDLYIYIFLCSGIMNYGLFAVLDVIDALCSTVAK